MRVAVSFFSGVVIGARNFQHYKYRDGFCHDNLYKVAFGSAFIALYAAMRFNNEGPQHAAAVTAGFLLGFASSFLVHEAMPQADNSHKPHVFA